MVAQEATKQHYDSETGEWDGQLVHGAWLSRYRLRRSTPSLPWITRSRRCFFGRWT